jgi:hypothetical protein
VHFFWGAADLARWTTEVDLFIRRSAPLHPHALSQAFERLATRSGQPVISAA